MIENQALLDRYTHTIVQQVEAMKSMVNAFTEYARSPQPKAQQININSMLEEIALLYHQDNTNVTINLKLDKTIPEIAVDDVRLRQLVHNLIKNSLETVEGEGWIQLTTASVVKSKRNWIEFSVEDSGNGVADEVAQNLFDPYVTTKSSGSGLGLAIVKKIVDEHGGSVRVERARQGGARFSVLLPLGDDDIIEADAGVESHAEVRGNAMSARILVVDDEPDIRYLLKDILEDEGYLVDVAEDARAANEIRRSIDPDLVLLDIWMPQVDGVTLLKQWKASADDRCPVVMMSGHGTVETAVEATRYGAIDFVEKPLSMAKLLSTVKAALSRGEQSERLDNRRRREQPVGTSRLLQKLKQRLLELRGSSQAVFLTGPLGSGKRIWADFLCATSGGVQVYDGSRQIRDLMPLGANLYIGEIAELEMAQQVQLRDAVLTNNRESRFRGSCWRAVSTANSWRKMS